MKETIAKNLGLGVEIAIVILLPIYIGFSADEYLSTQPWLFLFGSLVSSGGFVKVMNRIQKQYRRELEELKDKDGKL